MEAKQRRALLDEVERDIESARRELSDLTRIRNYLLRSIGEAPPNEDSPPPPPGQTNTSGAISKAEGATAVLRAAGPGKPLKTGQIVDELVQTHGFPRGSGRGLERKLFNVLTRRTDLFAKVAPGLWTLVEFSKGSSSPPGGARPDSTDHQKEMEDRQEEMEA